MSAASGSSSHARVCRVLVGPFHRTSSCQVSCKVGAGPHGRVTLVSIRHGPMKQIELTKLSSTTFVSKL